MQVVVDEITLATNQLQDGQTRRKFFHHVLQAQYQNIWSIGSSHENRIAIQRQGRLTLESEARISDSQSPSKYQEDSRIPFFRGYSPCAQSPEICPCCFLQVHMSYSPPIPITLSVRHVSWYPICWLQLSYSQGF